MCETIETPITLAPTPSNTPKVKWPIHVIGVVKSLDSADEQLILAPIRTLCQEEGLLFSLRAFDSYKYRHDRDNIERLPALHLYINHFHEITFYPLGRPRQIIKDTIAAYQKQKEARREKRERRRGFLARILQKVRGLFHQKTRLERAEELRLEEELAAKQRRSLERRGLALTMDDWN